MLREFVHRLRWLEEDDFLTGLALAQAFPGVNVVNLAIWIGYRLRGTPGALASVTGIVVPPAILVVVIGAVFTSVSRYPVTHLVLNGLAAAAIGLSLQTGIIACRRVFASSGWGIALMMLAFVAGGILRLPLPLIILVLGPIGVACAAWQLSRA
jgi:chromate transporter